MDEDFFSGDVHMEAGDETQMSDVASDDMLRGKGKRKATTVVIGGPSKKARKEVKDPPKRARPAKKTPVELPVEDPNCLYEVVRQGKGALTTVVDEWIESYKLERDSALLQLIQFFIQCSGCRGKITLQMQENMDHAQIIRKMTEEFDEESGDYPLIMPGPQWKKFRSNFCEFIQVLVRQCQYSIIYDQYLMDNIISLLTGLSDSQVRAFRHTATLAAMKLMTALVDVALNLSISLDNTQRQHEAERQKNRDKRATERLELLMSKRQELEENTEEIKNMLMYMFKSVFVHRYRDTVPEIRSICMSEIGIWMKKFHQNFLDDSYLKYIGWTLHDKCGDVRLKCLQALQPLYSSEELTGKLELFTNKFKDRIVAMTLDKEFEVAVQAVKLVISILKWNVKVNNFNDPHQKMYHKDILTDKDCEHVYELVYSSHRAVAQAAGEFLNERLFTPDEDNVKGLKTKRGKKRSINTPLIRDLVQFFIESELHEHGAYLVDSLIESNPMMKDWECMTDLLLEEPGPEEEPLDDRQETSLIEIMVCCVRQAATGEPPVGRGPTRKQLSAKEAKQVQDDKVKLTEHFITMLHPLLNKYLADPEKVANLLSIPQYFDLEIYTSGRMESHLDLLMKAISEIVDKHTEAEVLEACAKTFETLCQEDTPIHTRCEISRQTLLDSLVAKYIKATEEYQQIMAAGGELDVDDVFALTSSLKKVACFCNCHDLSRWEPWESLLDWVKLGNAVKNVPEEVVKYAISACYSSIMWELHKLDEINPTEAGLNTTRERLHSFMAVCREMLNNSSDNFKAEAFTTICDLLIVFCKQLLDNQLLRSVVYDIDSHLQAQLTKFIQEKVFIEDHDDESDEHLKIEELHRRRNFLAAFCKLVVYNVVSVRVASDVFKHYVKFYNDYGDIIKATLGKAREINKVNTARTMALSLTGLFRELQQNQGGIVDRQSESFTSIKELAKRFALSFGLDQVKNRDAVAALHRESIIFALTPLENPDDPGGPPPNMAFLEILCEFTNKLMKQDKKVILSFLEQRLAPSPTCRGDEWQPYAMYRTSLLHGEGDMPIPKPAARQYRGKRKVVDDLRPVEDDDNDDRDSDHSNHPKKF
ncbi:hypothetical protein CHUAL_001371 [Chamberlinius hualienensis]